MAARRGGRTVRVRGAGVQDVRVGEELHVAYFEDHVQGHPLACSLEDVGGAQLGGREGGDGALGGEAVEGADVVRVPSEWCIMRQRSYETPPRGSLGGLWSHGMGGPGERTSSRHAPVPEAQDILRWRGCTAPLLG